MFSKMFITLLAMLTVLAAIFKTEIKETYLNTVTDGMFPAAPCGRIGAWGGNGLQMTRVPTMPIAGTPSAATLPLTQSGRRRSASGPSPSAAARRSGMRVSPGSRRIIEGSPLSRGGNSAREVHRLGDLDLGNVLAPVHQGADPRDCKDVSPAAPAGALHAGCRLP